MLMIKKSIHDVVVDTTTQAPVATLLLKQHR